MTIGPTVIQSSFSTLSSSAPAPDGDTLSAAPSLNGIVREEKVSVRSVPGPFSAQISRLASPAQNSEAEAPAKDSPSEETQEKVNVHRIPNPIPELIAETRRVVVASALKLRYGFNSLDTAIRFGAPRSRLAPLENVTLNLQNSQEEPTETALRFRVPRSIAERFTFTSPNFRLPGVEIDLRV